MVSYEHWPEARVLRRIRLDTSHLPTGRTRHYSDNHLLPPPSELVIARHDDVARHSISEPLQSYASYYLFYLDENGAELTDMCEQTLADALAQAGKEFGIRPEEWKIISEDES
jgi:hypothetical protein